MAYGSQVLHSLTLIGSVGLDYFKNDLYVEPNQNYRRKVILNQSQILLTSNVFDQNHLNRNRFNYYRHIKMIKIPFLTARINKI